MKLSIIHDFENEDTFSAYDFSEIAIAIEPSKEIVLKEAVIQVYLANEYVKGQIIRKKVLISSDFSMQYAKTLKPIEKEIHFYELLAQGKPVAFFLNLGMNLLDRMKNLPDSITNSQTTFKFKIDCSLMLKPKEEIMLSETIMLKNPWYNS